MTIAAITDMPALAAGQLSDNTMRKDCIPGTSEEASATILPGTVVKQGAADHGVLLPTATTNLLRGVAVFGHSYSPGVQVSATDGGYLPGVTFDVLKAGRIPIRAGAAMVPGNHVHVQVVADTGYPVGVVRPDADATKSIDITGFAQVFESGDATNPPVIDFDFGNAGLGVADS